MSKHLHIITHDVPYPANFGGVIDIFYKLVSLHKIGIKIHLHCFVNKRQPQKEIEKYCETVHYYPRKKLTGISTTLPFIVTSRRNKNLLQNLNSNQYPILFEGIHSTYYLHKNEFVNRQTFIRLFNIEYIYYTELAKNESNIFRKLYYIIEAKLLKKYEKNIATKATILALSTQDASDCKQMFDAKAVEFIPVFLPYKTINIEADKGLYCLYHANLAINENEKVAIWLIKNVFAKLQISLIIAGNKPSKKIQNIAAKNKFVSIVSSPTEVNMQLLIAHAQINILPSFNNTGVKLKLLNALFNGRYCLVNKAGANGSGVEELCIIAETASNFMEHIEKYMLLPFTQKEMQHRSVGLKKLYNNEANAQIINEWLQ